jgi:hypothetical protein
MLRDLGASPTIVEATPAAQRHRRVGDGARVPDSHGTDTWTSSRRRPGAWSRPPFAADVVDGRLIGAEQPT